MLAREAVSKLFKTFGVAIVQRTSLMDSADISMKNIAMAERPVVPKIKINANSIWQHGLHLIG